MAKNRNNQSQLNMEQFSSYIAEHLFDDNLQLKENTEVLPVSNNKGNGVILDGLIIKSKSSNIAPTVYLNRFYEEYLNGTSLNSIIKNIVEYYNNLDIPQISLDYFTNYESVKKDIFLKLINASKNEKFLEECPHYYYGDLAVVFLVSVNLGKENDNGTINITNKHAELWNVTASDLLAQAKINIESHNQIKIGSITEVLKELAKEYDESDEFSFLEGQFSIPMYIMTLSKGVYGAAAMLFEDKLYEFAQQRNSNLYILPSSINEVILIDAENLDDSHHVSWLMSTVFKVNRTTIDAVEFLSDNVYFYDKDKRKLYISSTKEEVFLSDAKIVN